eukprot:CAMPEP_0183743072 /NCGR_PEP_ID=MMETSP0737-20130205/65027_1 /TAXON_ID=385413 /ORGANISM="Thalassiosira miniscula, Strain CCMP1093" /LENGTH=448 /DNA_ID=CAMNT_0025978677 /DNA_START=458 /DNA_END=1801 /DNA_ORIENTATION=-
MMNEANDIPTPRPRNDQSSDTTAPRATTTTGTPPKRDELESTLQTPDDAQLLQLISRINRKLAAADADATPSSASSQQQSQSNSTSAVTEKINKRVRIQKNASVDAWDKIEKERRQKDPRRRRIDRRPTTRASFANGPSTNTSFDDEEDEDEYRRRITLDLGETDKDSGPDAQHIGIDAKQALDNFDYRAKKKALHMAVQKYRQRGNGETTDRRRSTSAPDVAQPMAAAARLDGEGGVQDSVQARQETAVRRRSSSAPNVIQAMAAAARLEDEDDLRDGVQARQEVTVPEFVLTHRSSPYSRPSAMTHDPGLTEEMRLASENTHQDAPLAECEPRFTLEAELVEPMSFHELLHPKTHAPINLDLERAFPLSGNINVPALLQMRGELRYVFGYKSDYGRFVSAEASKRKRAFAEEQAEHFLKTCCRSSHNGDMEAYQNIMKEFHKRRIE